MVLIGDRLSYLFSCLSVSVRYSRQHSLQSMSQRILLILVSIALLPNIDPY